jgi:DNA-binding response OmpR family regulator
MLMRHLLASMGCDVADARNGVDAEEVAARIQPDLVLLDIMMPIQDGYETASNLRRSGYSGSIVMCSSLQAKHEEVRTQSAGADGYIQKPFTRDSIWPILNSLRAQKAVSADSR